MSEMTKQLQFWDCLDRWHRVVQHMHRKGRAPLGVTDDVYCRLHRDLLAHIKASEAGKVMQSLHHSVRPWVNLDSLAHCDKRVLRMLEQEVRLIRNRSMPRQYWHRQMIHRMTIGMFLLVICVIMIGWVSSGDERALGFLGIVQGGWDYVQGLRVQLWHGILRSTMNQRLVVLAASIVLVGMFFLRSPKTS